TVPASGPSACEPVFNCASVGALWANSSAQPMPVLTTVARLIIPPVRSIRSVLGNSTAQA
ncbi:MAG TPA: hypothetical protein VMB50_10660, partial [Myxococcales bacterium]|nr:hypothetical protein [Myxococcales bacterium]